jgi:hypothetical protein
MRYGGNGDLMKYFLIAAMAVLFSPLGPIHGVADEKKGEVPVIEQQILELMKKLDALDERSRMQLLSQIDAQRNELLGVLLKQLGSSPSKNVQAAALYLIGRHHLSDGVSELIRRIDFDSGRLTDHGPEPLWEQYPAMEALITMGKPSVPAAIELLAADKNDLRRNLAVKVIRYVEGADVAEFVLQRAEAKESDASRKSMLSDALVRLRQLIQQTR